MNNKIVIKNREPQAITISGGGEVLGITTVYVNDVDVTEGSVAYVIVPTKTSQLINDSRYITNETDPTIPYYIKQITQADINNWDNKQQELISGVNIKTINNNSLLGSGNIDVSTSYTAGTGIEITNENVINNTITSYDDLDDLPTIPTQTSQLVNDSGFVVSSELSRVAFSGSYAELSDTPEIPAFTSELTNDGENGTDPFITNKTNELENYYNKDFMWNMLPKVSGTGSTINLDNTVDKAPLYLTLNATELSQDGTPTPDSPQDIHTISGSNTIKVEGKQLFDKEIADVIVGYFDTSGNVQTGGTSSITRGYIPIKPNTNMTISGMPFTVFCFYDNNKNFVERIVQSTSSYTFSKNANYIRVQGATSDFDVNSIMLNKGNTALPYTPYTLETKDIDLPVENLLNTTQQTFSFEPNTTNYQNVASEAVSLVAGTKYYISYTIDNATTGNVRSTPRLYLDASNYYQNTATNRNLTKGRKVDEYTPSTSGLYQVQYWLQGSNEKVSVSNIMISTSSSTSYTPYGTTPIECGSIGNYENIPIRTSGKNILNVNDSENGGIDGSGNLVSGDTLRRATNYIEVEPNTTYTFSRKTFSDSKSRFIRLYEYNSSKTFISPRVESSTATLTLTTSANTKYLKWSIFEDQATFTLDIVKTWELQIEKGSATSYEPYGNGTWYLKQEIGKVVLDGTESWQFSTVINDNYGFYLIKDDVAFNTTNEIKVLSNYFKGKTPDSVIGDGETGISTRRGTGQGLYIRMYNATEMTAEDLKTFLSNNNSPTYYVLATPQYLPITGTLAEQLENVYKNMLSQKGQTNISQVNDDLPFTISAITLKSLENL